jgi:NDP-sugar pyrophosphorylase family protein
MILAAGLGTRLRPLTDHGPKALVKVAGRTMLEITLARLRSFDVRDVIINVHHFAEQVIAYLKANHNFGMHIEVSREEILLDTGGGLKKAAHFFPSAPGGPEEPFILHNVDVVSDIDLRRMLQFHAEKQALATLAVQNRTASRYLLFDDHFQLCGRESKNQDELVCSSPSLQPLAFTGIHVISPRLLPLLTEQGAFSVITSYLRLAAQGEKILSFRADRYYWRDLGRPESIQQAVGEVDRF